MSIETLLEAARFLELQAQQQQKAREENELRDKLRLEQLAEHSISYSSQQPLHYTNTNHHNTNHVLKAEESPPLHYTNANRVFKAEEEEEEPRGPHRHRPPPVPPPASIPITIIPMIPVVTSSSSNRPATAGGLPSPHHHQPVAPRLLASPKWDPRHSPPGHQGGVTTTTTPSSSLPISPPRQPDLSSPSSSASALNHKQPQNHQQQQQHHLQATPCANNNAKPQQTQQQQQLVVQQRYPGGGTIVSAPQPHALVAPPPPPSLLPQQATPPQTSPSPGSRGSPPDDGSGHHLDGKKRPGGAGTREVHNKLEKNRRAHLKECFDTLKKNIPNVDEKKTSNLSVLRSALRYIQTLKRKEKEYEHEMERLAREKIATQQRLSELKKELSQWMDVMEMERVLRQTVQPEEDQASTSTASEGEDIMDEDLDDDPAPRARPPAPTSTTPSPQALQPELRPTVTTVTLAPMSSTPPSTSSSTTLVSIQHQQPLLQPPPQSQQAVALSSPLQPLSIRPTTAPYTPSSSSCTPTPIHATLLPQPTAHATLLPQPTTLLPQPTTHATLQPTTHATLQPTVIAHAAASHASVIQAVNHVIQAGGPKHIAHLAPATTAGGTVQLTAAHHQHQHHPQPISHITVHPLPVAHLSQHLPALYSPQPVVAASQPAVVGHITHTLTHAHAQVNGTAPGHPTATVVGKQTPVGTAQVVTAHHPQLVGQTMTMVTMPSFPVSTLKLA